MAQRRRGGEGGGRRRGREGGETGREVVPGARPRMLAAPAAATAQGAAWGLGRSHQAPLGPFPGAETHAAAGGSAGPSRPAQPEVSARRRGGGAGAAGEEAGPGHLSGRRLGLPSARRPLPSLSRGRVAGWAAGGAGGPRSELGPRRSARAGSLPPPRRFSAAAAPQPGSGGSAPPCLPPLSPLPQAGLGGA